MIDSTNPRCLADNIRHLIKKIAAIPIVQGNPTGSGYNTLITKLKIGNTKYKLPSNVIANPEGDAIAQITKIQIGDTIYQFDAITPPAE